MKKLNYYSSLLLVTVSITFLSPFPALNASIISIGKQNIKVLDLQYNNNMVQKLTVKKIE